MGVISCPRCNAAVTSSGQLRPILPGLNTSSLNDRFTKCPQCHFEILLTRTTKEILSMEHKLERMRRRYSKLREKGREVSSLARAISILEKRLIQAKLEAGLR